MSRISFLSLFLFGFALLLGLGAFGFSAASGGRDPYAVVAIVLAALFAAGVIALFTGRVPTASKRAVLLAATPGHHYTPQPRASFGEGLVRFVRLEPVRTFFAIRLLIYVTYGIIQGSTLDTQELLNLIAGILGVAATDTALTSGVRNRTIPAVVDYELGKLSAAGQVGAFAANLVRSLVPQFIAGGTIGKALEVILPYIGPIAGNVLTPDLQRTVTAQVHDALRNAGLIRRVDLPAVPGAGA